MPEDMASAQDVFEKAQDELKAKEEELKTAQKRLDNADGDLKVAQNELKAAQNELKAAQNELKAAIETGKPDNLVRVLAQARDTAEEARHTAEEARHTAEKARDTAEKARDTAEKIWEDARQMRNHWLSRLDQMAGKVDGSAEIKAAIEDLARQQSAAQQQQSAVQGAVIQLVIPLALSFARTTMLQPIPPTIGASSWSTWHPKAMEHYNNYSCMVLSSKFPQPAQRWWTVPNWFPRTLYPAVAEHIVPKDSRYTLLAQQYGIDQNHPCNSLLLLRHLEQQYQYGNWTAVPTRPGFSDEFVDLRIHVSDEIKDEPIMYQGYFTFEGGESPVQIWDASVQSWRGITFGELNGHIFRVEPTPYLQALYLKAAMAYIKHPDEFPNPDTEENMRCYRLTPRRSARNIERLVESLRTLQEP